jgi:hypothetical protein
VLALKGDLTSSVSGYSVTPAKERKKLVYVLVDVAVMEASRVVRFLNP